METVTTPLTRNHLIKDDVFDTQVIEQYALSLQVGHDSFRFCVIDTVFKKCLWLEDYNFEAVFSPDQLVRQLEDIYHDHIFLSAGFWKEIRLSFRNQYFTFIPTALFKADAARDYLQFSTNHTIPSQDVFSHYHPYFQSVNVFKADHQSVAWFRNKYFHRDVSIVHQNSAFIEGTMQQKLSSAEKTMFISIERNYMTIVVLQPDKQLLFCNSFAFQNEQDFVYYVMLTMDGLQLNPEICKVYLFGEIVEDSGVFTNLFKYVRNVFIGTRPAHLRFSHRFDEVLEHRYFDLYNLYLCD
jgi:hypothetical protein